LQFRNQPQETLENYRRGLALGGSRPLPELFQGAGIRFDFSAETLRPIMAAVEEELARL
jgi:oligoendopeptidase F